MQEQFDKYFSKKVKSAFSNHQEEFNPEHWEAMKRKMAKKKRKIIPFPIIAKAATIFLVLTFSAIVLSKQLKMRYIGKKTTLSAIESNNIQDLFKKSQKIDCVLIVDTKKTKIIQPHVSKNKVQILYNQLFICDGDSFKNQNNTINISDITIESTNQAIGQKHNTHQNDSMHITTTNNSKQISDSLNIQIDKQIEQIRIAHHKKEKEKYKRFNIGVSVASVYNYGKEIQSKTVDYNGGVLASFNITKSLTLHSGALFTHNKLEMQQDANLTSELTANQPTYNVIDTENPELEMIGIDIPLNITYKINNIRIGGGISSIYYLSEHQSVDYQLNGQKLIYDSYSNDYEVINVTKNVNNTAETSVSGKFAFAQLINLSIGYDFPLRKSVITLEPFMKYPMGTISKDSYKYSTGGLSLKFSF